MKSTVLAESFPSSCSPSSTTTTQERLITQKETMRFSTGFLITWRIMIDRRNRLRNPRKLIHPIRDDQSCLSQLTSPNHHHPNSRLNQEPMLEVRGVQEQLCIPNPLVNKEKEPPEDNASTQKRSKSIEKTHDNNASTSQEATPILHTKVLLKTNHRNKIDR